MARIARVVVEGIPHHVTQRGARRQQTFFGTDDYRVYLELMAEWCARSNVTIWAYCLMPNHVHLIAVPATADGLHRGIAEAHRRYTRHVNFREGWRGYLWQGRFASYPMDERYLLAAARYIELNPVRARLTAQAGDYRWSSAAAHLAGRDDGLARVRPLLDLVPKWGEFLACPPDADEADAIRSHARTGRPLGDDAFLDRLERFLNRPLRPLKRGPKPRDATS